MAKSISAQLELAVSTAFKRATNAALAKTAEDTRRALGYAAYHGASAMRDKILNSPTGTDWHARYSAERGRPGARYETGTMFGSVSRTRGKIVESPDKRRKAKAVASFGWPVDNTGMLKDMPSNPMSKGTDMPSNPYGQWRDDPRYQLMQEFGFNNEGTHVPGMFSQHAGIEAARGALNSYLKRLGYK